MSKSKEQNWEELFRAAIENTGLKIKELSKITGVSESQLSRFIRGERTIKLTTAEKIAAVVNLEIKSKKARR